MIKCFKKILTLGLILGVSICTAKPNAREEIAHRDFWHPTYHIQRLNYCLLDGTTCGFKVANEYCRLMGYCGTDQAEIDYNVGLTHYLHSNATCKGWRCHGFKVIRCVNKIIHKPAAPYYYRSKRFDVPRFNHYRVDWCLEKNKGCGSKAAVSFCRRLGYMQAGGFKQQDHLPATKTLGSQELCFGGACIGFREITCYR